MTSVPPTPHIPYEELEVGHHLDQAVRAAVTVVGQMLERAARSTADRDRQAAQALRDAMLQQQLHTPQSRPQTLSSSPMSGPDDPADPTDLGRSASGPDEWAGLGVRASGYLDAAGDFFGDAPHAAGEVVGSGVEGVVDEVTGGVRPGAPAGEGQVSARRVAWAWSLAMADIARDPADADAAAAAAELHDYARLRFDGLDLAAAVSPPTERTTQRTPKQTTERTTGHRDNGRPSPIHTPTPAAAAPKEATVTGEVSRVAVLVPPGRANPDRGVAPSKAGTPEEAAHRRQAWAQARKDWETSRPDLDTPTARDSGWTVLSMPDKTRRYWQAYDTPTTRTVTTTTDRAAELGWAAPTSSTAAEATGASSDSSARTAGAGEGSDGGTPRGAVDRGIAPSKAATPAEAERRRQAWRAAEDSFTSTLPAGTGPTDASAAWEGLSWQDKAPLYWRAYEQTPTAAETPVSGVAITSPPVAAPDSSSRLTGTADGTGRSTVAPVRSLSARGEVGGGAEPGEVSGVSRARVVELNVAAADWFAAQAGPGSRGRTYLQDRVGADVTAASLPVAATAPPGMAIPAAEPQWRLGYAPPGWTGLVDHLRQAGARDEELLTAGLARTSSRGTLIDVFRDRAMVAIRDRDGDVVGFVGRDLSGHAAGVKYVNTGQTPAFRKGDHLLGAYEALHAPAARVMRTEGPFDAIAVTAAGGGQTVGVTPLGTALTPTQAELLANLANSRDAACGHGRVWIATDADPAGRAAAARDFWTLRQYAQCVDARLLPLPTGTDPAQLWQDEPATLRLLLQVADDAPPAAVAALDDAITRLRPSLVAGDPDAQEQVAAGFDLAMDGATDVDRRQVGQYLDRRLDQERPSAAAEDPDGLLFDAAIEEPAWLAGSPVAEPSGSAGEAHDRLPPVDAMDNAPGDARVNSVGARDGAATDEGGAEPTVDELASLPAAEGPVVYDRSRTASPSADSPEVESGAPADRAGAGEGLYARQVSATAFSRTTRDTLAAGGPPVLDPRLQPGVSPDRVRGRAHRR
ncbi:toprim domain-containing protein (plasmid) [Dermatophilaceae bacterium Soc4.6]